MQQPEFRSRAFPLFHSYNIDELPQIYGWFEEMRSQRPVFRDERTPLPIWQIFRYEDVLTVLTDYQRFSSAPLSGVGFAGSFIEDTLVAKDPPDHRKLRNLVNQAFTPRAVMHLSERVKQITQELLDEVREKGTMDIVSDIAFPLPAKIIADMLGVPAEDWDIFQRWARGDDGQRRPASRQAGATMQDEMALYFAGLLEERRRNPREDLITALSKAEIDGERLNNNELVNFCTLLLAAGQETTKNLLANALVCFTDHPDTMEKLVQEPGLMPSAVEEVLRYLSPVWFLFRHTKTDVELNGQHIPAHQLVLPWIASANRDAHQFPHADRFDIQREPNRHVGFGHGIHYCVGAPLARLEAKIALSMMLEQLKDIRRVESQPIIANMGIVFVIHSLPITFKA